MLQLNAFCSDLLMLPTMIKLFFSKFPTRDQPKKYQTFLLKESPCRQWGLNSAPLGYNNDPSGESATVSVAVSRISPYGALLQLVFLSAMVAPRDPYFNVPAETQSYVIKLSCPRKVLAASGD